MRFSGKDWYLVRRDAGDLKTGGKTCSGYDPDCWDPVGGDNCWHQADDNLAGTATYGTDGPKYDLTPQGTSSYSLRFDNLMWDSMLLASGDLSMYVVMEPQQLS